MPVTRRNPGGDGAKAKGGSSGGGGGGGPRPRELIAHPKPFPILTESSKGGGGKRGKGGNTSAPLAVPAPDVESQASSPGRSIDAVSPSENRAPNKKKKRKSSFGENAKQKAAANHARIEVFQKDYTLEGVKGLFKKASELGDDELDDEITWPHRVVQVYNVGLNGLFKMLNTFSDQADNAQEDEDLVDQMTRSRELLAEKQTGERYNQNMIWNKMGEVKRIFGKFIKDFDEQAITLAERCLDEKVDGKLVEAEVENLQEAYNAIKDLVTNETDAVGASVIHLAYLFRNYELGRWLVKLFPEAAMKGYSATSKYRVKGTSSKTEMPYAGENVLHVTIVRRNHKEARWLLDYFRDAPAPDNVIKAMNHFSTEIEDLKYAKDELIEGGGTQDTASFKEALAKFEAAKANLASLSPEDEGYEDAQKDVTAAELDHKSVARKEYMAAKMATDEYKERKAAREKWLGNMLSAKVTGTFFSKKGKFYFGETPLHFAVAANDQDMFNLVLGYYSSYSPNALFIPASNGDNVFHLCVWHGLHNMYEHISYVARSIIRQEIEIVLASRAKILEKIRKRETDTLEQPKNETEQQGDLEEMALDKELQWYRPSSLSGENALYLPTLGQLTFPADFKGRLKICEEIDLVEYEKRGEMWRNWKIDVVLDDRLLLCLNEDLHSPLTLAAERGNKDTLVFIIGKARRVMWTFGPTTCYHVDLDGFELPHKTFRIKDVENNKKEKYELYEPIVRIAEWRKMQGVVQLCAQRITSGKSGEVIDIESVKKLIEAKWHRLGKDRVYFNSYIFITSTVIFTVFYLFHIPLCKYAWPSALFAIPWILALAIVVHSLYMSWAWSAFFGFSSSANNGTKKWWLFLNTIVCSLSLYMFSNKVKAWILNGSFTEQDANFCWPYFALLAAVICLYKLVVEVFNFFNKESIKTTLRGAAKWQEFSYIIILLLVGIKMLLISLPLLANCDTCTAFYASAKGALNEYAWVPIKNYNGTDVHILVDKMEGFKEGALKFIDTFSSPCTSLLAVWMWIHSIFFSLLAFDLTGPLLLKIRHVICDGQTRFFLFFFVFLLVGFGLSIMKDMKDQVGDSWLQLLHFGERILFLAGEAMEIDGCNGKEDGKNCKNEGNFFATIIFIFILFCKMVLFNILLAVMQDIYKDRKEDNEQLYLAEKYNLTNGVLNRELKDAANELDDTKDEKFKRMYAVRIREKDQPKKFVFEFQSDSGDWKENKSTSTAVATAKENPSHFHSMTIRTTRARHPVVIHHTDTCGKSKQDRSLARYVDKIRYGSVWQNANKEHPEPNTQITHHDVIDGVWQPVDPNYKLFCLYYTKQLEKEGQTLTIQDNLKTALLIIDAQKDFHDGGSLAVHGATKDSQRVAAMIMDHLLEIDEIFYTQDSHFPDHIAHAESWEDEDGNQPTPFTVITAAEVEDGKWSPTNEEWKDYAIYYCKELEKGDKFQLTIWPPHCIVGSPGHDLVDNISNAIKAWEKAWQDKHKVEKKPTIIRKGMNKRTEMYSAIQSEVVDNADHATHLNSSLVTKLNMQDKLYVCGEALSHCVQYTVSDLLNYWLKKPNHIYLLEDGSTMFRDASDKFLHDMKSKGVKIIKCADAFPPPQQQAHGGGRGGRGGVGGGGGDEDGEE